MSVTGSFHWHYWLGKRGDITIPGQPLPENAEAARQCFSPLVHATATGYCYHGDWSQNGYPASCSAVGFTYAPGTQGERAFIPCNPRGIEKPYVK